MGILGKIAGFLFGAFFTSLKNIFFPQETAAYVKVDQLTEEVKTLNAEAQAAAAAPTSMEALIAEQKRGDV